MNLTFATLLAGLVLIAVGLPICLNRPTVTSSLKRLPRSRKAAILFFGIGAMWFLYRIWHLSEADFGQYRVQLFFFFAAVAGAAFFVVPDFLAVRGLAVLVLLGSSPLLNAAYMEYGHPQRLLMVTAVFAAIVAAIYLGASPFRLRDFIEWLFRRPSRARVFGSMLAGYGLLLCVVAFSY